MGKTCIRRRHVSASKKSVYEHDMCIRIRHVSTDKTCITDKICNYGQDMCLRRRHVYREKTCVYRKDMYLRTRQVYSDNTSLYGHHIQNILSNATRMMSMVFSYLHNSKTSALQQKCHHSSGFLNGTCLRTRHLFGIDYYHTYDRIKDLIRKNLLLNNM